MRNFHLRLELLDLLVRDESRIRFLQLQQTIVIPARLEQRRPRSRGLRSRRCDRGRGTLGCRAILRGVDLEKELALRDLIPLLDRQANDSTGDVRREVDLVVRLHLPARRHRGDQIASLDLLDANFSRLVAALCGAQHSDQNDREDDSAADTPFRLFRHLMCSRYLSGRPTALSSAANALW